MHNVPPFLPLIIAYLQKFAQDRSLECKTDKAGNVLIVKEAAPGYENRPTIVLQSHSDMVCEKNEGVQHDFAKDPIRYVIEDGWMIAPDTTLGADSNASTQRLHRKTVKKELWCEEL